MTSLIFLTSAEMLSGVASSSDILAGEAIAAQVAATTLARYRTDGMGQAGGNPTLWKELQHAAVARGLSMPWKSMELPARPGMLPLFGNVKQFLITTTQRDSLRPPPPPAIGSAEFCFGDCFTGNFIPVTRGCIGSGSIAPKLCNPPHFAGFDLTHFFNLRQGGFKFS